jgi:RNase adapter protein RapZ
MLSVEKLEVLIVSGLSGSGKSVVSKALEDIGYRCIDNMPIGLFERLLLLLAAGRESQSERVALVMDSRDTRLDEGREKFERFRKEKKLRLQIVFLECNDYILERRFKETRRKHPMALSGSVSDGIARERQALDWIREMADEVVDTSETTVHQLRNLIQSRFGVVAMDRPFHVTFVSFGFKYGIVQDADLVMDVRFLPNPYFEPDLKFHTGQEEAVAQFVLEKTETGQFIEQFSGLLDFLLPNYRKEGKHYLTVAIGCTGGMHRSVAITEALAERYSDTSVLVATFHRDIGKTL